MNFAWKSFNHVHDNTIFTVIYYYYYYYKQYNVIMAPQLRRAVTRKGIPTLRRDCCSDFVSSACVHNKNNNILIITGRIKTVIAGKPTRPDNKTARPSNIYIYIYKTLYINYYTRAGSKKLKFIQYTIIR